MYAERFSFANDQRSNGQLQIILKYFHIAGRKRQTDEEKHREVRGTRLRHYAAKDFIAR